jgi:hypothetical protein
MTEAEKIRALLRKLDSDQPGEQASALAKVRELSNKSGRPFMRDLLHQFDNLDEFATANAGLKRQNDDFKAVNAGLAQQNEVLTREAAQQLEKLREAEAQRALDDPSRQGCRGKVDAPGPRGELTPFPTRFIGYWEIGGAVEAGATQGQRPIDAMRPCYHAAAGVFN